MLWFRFLKGQSGSSTDYEEAGGRRNPGERWCWGGPGVCSGEQGKWSDCDGILKVELTGFDRLEGECEKKRETQADSMVLDLNSGKNGTLIY